MLMKPKPAKHIIYHPSDSALCVGDLAPSSLLRVSLLFCNWGGVHGAPALLRFACAGRGRTGEGRTGR